MAAIMNGIALHGGFIPYGGTFLMFSDYGRNALRMAALMKTARRSTCSRTTRIGLGEDGPTHQPVEHAATLRLIPNLDVWRPCDTVETAVAWAARDRTRGRAERAAAVAAEPAAHGGGADRAALIARGGYVLAGLRWNPGAVLIATAPKSRSRSPRAACWRQKGVKVRVVSMPSTTVFDRQDAAWRDSVLPPGSTR